MRPCGTAGCLGPPGLLKQNTTDWMAYKQKFISHSLEAGRSKIKAPADVSGEGGLPGSQTVVSSPCPHMVERTRELSGISVTRALTPLMRAVIGG